METFTSLKPLMENPFFHRQREKVSRCFDASRIDTPIVELIQNFLKRPYCFTLQCCHGHFVHDHQKNPMSIEPLPQAQLISVVEYRIAYIALCIENNDQGKILLQKLNEIPSIDPDYIQFGCAGWFWEKYLNSYALQVEPIRYQTKDRVFIHYEEALHIEKVRNKFFTAIGNIIASLKMDE